MQEFRPTAVFDWAWRVQRDALDYAIDGWQRGVLFSDILRRRGNIYLEHLARGQPPVLVFPYETVVDGRRLERPVNYALVRILDRRVPAQPQRPTEDESGASDTDRRTAPIADPTTESRRPIVIIDPRAGHGPGIGGSKLDSQIGVALNFGHPVYFVLFFTDPEPGQTLHDVQQAEVHFLEEVVRRHPQAEPPAVIGNCQAGWATALVGADRPDITGPMVFNGSPLSYWGGVEGANPMRYRGGLYGGVWLTSLWCDLGNGIFDGAHLVAGFEDLNPANTLWTKQYNVWARVDTEADRYLTFEKWWGGFFKMNDEEIHFIVDSLFVGNELEHGALQLKEGHPISLKNFQDPIVVFASKGDNITPPQQALNWIVKVYGSTEEIKRCGQTIVYLLHEGIGHLGIFVSGRVAGREHREILGSVEMIEFLAPGLYEMIIREEPSKPWLNDHRVAFEEREIEDILRLDDGLEDEDAFPPVAALSRFNDRLYRSFAAPWVQRFATDDTAEWLRQAHPLRMQRYLLSDLNPWLRPVAWLVPAVEAARRPRREDNLFLAAESAVSRSTEAVLDYWRQVRDDTQEFLFKQFYGNPWMQALFAHPERAAVPAAAKPEGCFPDDAWRAAMARGGFAEGIVRIVLAVMGANRSWSRRQYDVVCRIVAACDRLQNLTGVEIKRISRRQATYLQRDRELALDTLGDLLPTPEDRQAALEIAHSVATADLELDAAETDVLGRMEGILAVQDCVR